MSPDTTCVMSEICATSRQAATRGACERLDHRLHGAVVVEDVTCEPDLVARRRDRRGVPVTGARRLILPAAAVEELIARERPVLLEGPRTTWTAEDVANGLADASWSLGEMQGNYRKP